MRRRAQNDEPREQAGRPLNLVPDLLITGPKLEGVSLSILKPGLTVGTTVTMWAPLSPSWCPCCRRTLTHGS